MPILVLVPRVVRRYMDQFPEVWHNAYPYFNYDNRVVEERVPRGDVQRPYQGPDDFSDADYDVLTACAMSMVNPVLMRYSAQVAYDDALTMAIRSCDNGRFDGKINANRFKVLLRGMEARVMTAKGKKDAPKKDAPKKKAPEPKVRSVAPHVLKQLGIKHQEVPMKAPVRRDKGPQIYKTRGRVVVEK